MASKKYELTIDGTTFRFLEDVKMGNYKYTLEKLSYDKGIYRPAEMLVTMNVSGSPKYDDLVKAFSKKRVSLKISGNETAKNYFVFKVKPEFSTVALMSSVKLELTIYSMDKLMTLDKYSKAWTSQRLGRDILAKEMLGFEIQDEYITVCNDLQLIDNGSNELMQPYLVQYNESFYDFLRRTANRCGEFLYHEDGDLHLGITVLKDHKDTDYAELASHRYYEDILREGTETSDYGYNYMKSHADPDGKPYSDPLTCDDYLDDIDGKKLTSTGTQMGKWNKNLVSSICMALEGTSFAKILANIGVAYVFKSIQAAIAASSINAEYLAENVLPFNTNPDHKNAQDQIRQFGTAKDQSVSICGGLGNLTAKFYSLVRQAEKKVSENAVYLEFGDKTQNLRIGDQIKVDGTDFLVIGVRGECDLNVALLKERQQVVAVKFYTVNQNSTDQGSTTPNSLPIPPALPDVTVRESQPQLAFIVNTMDPKQIGRVRVRFAWQSGTAAASPWIRVQLPFASDGAGVKFMPEVGDEVMVSFEEGNVERPYVSGFLLSPRSNKSWGPLPDRSIVSKNGHGISFDDGTTGSSFFYQLYPGIQMVKSFFPNSTWPDTLSDKAGCQGLAGGMTLSDRYGLYRISLSSDSREVAIQSAMGDVKVSAFTGITISAPNGNVEIKGKNVSIEASNTVTIESGKAIKDRFIPDSSKYQECGVMSQNTLGRTTMDFLVNGGNGIRQRTVDNLLDMNLLRTVAEIVLRPIDGTTKIKSFTFVQVEAGKGSTEYPLDARKGDQQATVTSMMEAIDATVSAMSIRMGAIYRAHTNLCSAVQTFNALTTANQPNKEEAAISLDTVKRASWSAAKSPLTYRWENAHLDVRSENDINQDKDNAINQVKGDLHVQGEPKPGDDKYKNMLKAEADNLFKEDAEKWRQRMANIERRRELAMQERQDKLNKQNQVIIASENLQDAIYALYVATHTGLTSPDGIPPCNFRKEVQDALKSLKFDAFDDGDITKETHVLETQTWDNYKTHYKREAVRVLLAETKIGSKVGGAGLQFGSPGHKSDLMEADKWKDMVDKLLDPSFKATKAAKVAGAVKDWALEKFLDPWVDATVNRKRWKTGVEGRILLSDNPSKTITFDKNGAAGANWNIIANDKLADKLKEKLLAID